MANDFSWDDHPIVKAAQPQAAQKPASSPKSSSFSWDDHPIVNLPKPPDQPQTSAPQTALESYGNFMTGGYLPQAQALGDQALGKVGKIIYGDNFPDESYVQSRDANIARQNKENEEHPTAHKVGIGLALANQVGLMAPGAASVALAPELTMGQKIVQGGIAGAKGGAIYGALMNPGDTQGVVDPIQAKQRAINSGVGALFGAPLGAAAPVVLEGLARAGAKVGDKLSDWAERLAVNSTGATGKQASNFADDAGRELLDRGIVRFGDSQKQISQRAAQAVDQANAQIDSSLSKLQQDGVKVDANTIYNTVRNTINDMRTDPSQADIADNLERELDNLVKSTDAKGSTQYGVQEAEQIKRGFNRKAGNWADPEKGQAGKEMYQAFRGATEDAARRADQNMAALFEEGKKSYGLLAPIQEAAERRAATTQQSPLGGLLDTAAMVKGTLAGDPSGGILTAVARRMVSPRLASSAAVTADSLASILRKSPEIAKFESSNPMGFQSMVNNLLKERKQAQLAIPKTAQLPSVPVQAPELKGEDKWANDGMDQLQQHMDELKKQHSEDELDHEIFSNDDDKSAMLSNPKIKNLLVQASDLKPGSKAMQNIADKIRKLKA